MNVAKTYFEQSIKKTFLMLCLNKLGHLIEVVMHAVSDTTKIENILRECKQVDSFLYAILSAVALDKLVWNFLSYSIIALSPADQKPTFWSRFCSAFFKEFFLEGQNQTCIFHKSWKNVRRQALLEARDRRVLMTLIN